MPKLIITTPGFLNQSCELPDGEFAIGREAENTIIIRDQSVSGKHCELLVFGSEVIVRDRGSKNGTFVNGLRVAGQRQVTHHQIIRMGNVEARLELDAPGAENTTAWSAIEDLRRFSKAARTQPFPVTFAPVKKDAPRS